MADGRDDQVSDGSSTEDPGAESSSPSASNAHDPKADTGQVARIVAALRNAHAERAALAPSAEVPAPRRETTGVRPATPDTPTLRWNPGARYRASQLANRPAQQAPHAAADPAPSIPAAPSVPAPASDVPPPRTAAHNPVPAPPVPTPPVPAPPRLAGRLYRGPARRTGVFEREIWYPVTRSSRVPRDVSEALVAAVERYRKGSISTSGLVRAIGRAHAA